MLHNFLFLDHQLNCRHYCGRFSLAVGTLSMLWSLPSSQHLHNTWNENNLILLIHYNHATAKVVRELDLRKTPKMKQGFFSITVLVLVVIDFGNSNTADTESPIYHILQEGTDIIVSIFRLIKINEVFIGFSPRWNFEAFKGSERWGWF